MATSPTLRLDVDENGGLFEGYQLKLNSYDLGVDIELADALMRLRFEHPQVKVVLMRSAKRARVLCRREYSHAGRRDARAQSQFFANSPMRRAIPWRMPARILASALSASSMALRQAGAMNWHWRPITSFSLMMAIRLFRYRRFHCLPCCLARGGLTRVVDKRHVRRDHADVFCTIEERHQGPAARCNGNWSMNWPRRPKLEDKIVGARQSAGCGVLPRAPASTGISLAPVERRIHDGGIEYANVSVEIERARRIATIVVKGSEMARRRLTPMRWLRRARAFLAAAMRARTR